LALFLREQIILRLMLTLVWTVALALLSVLQELFLRVNKPIDNEKIKRKGAVQDLILVTDLSFLHHFAYSHILSQILRGFPQPRPKASPKSTIPVFSCQQTARPGDALLLVSQAGHAMI